MLKKVTKNDSIWKGQTSEFDDGYTLSAVVQWPKAPKKEPKSLPKWSLWAPKITKKQKSTNGGKQKTLKNTKMWMQKVSKKNPTGTAFSGG